MLIGEQEGYPRQGGVPLGHDVQRVALQVLVVRQVVQMAGGQRDHVLTAGVDHLLAQGVLEAGVDVAHALLQPHVFGDGRREGVDAGAELVQRVRVLRKRLLQLRRQLHRFAQRRIAADQHREERGEHEAQERDRQDRRGDAAQLFRWGVGHGGNPFNLELPMGNGKCRVPSGGIHRHL